MAAMGESVKYATKTYCTNPYGKKHAKIPKNKTFVPVTTKMVESSKGLIPDLKVGDYICRTCKLRIYSFVKKLNEESSKKDDYHLGRDEEGDENTVAEEVDQETESNDEAEMTEEKRNYEEDEKNGYVTESSLSGSSEESDDDDFSVPWVDREDLVKLLSSMKIQCDELKKPNPSAAAGGKVFLRVKSRLQEIRSKLHRVTGSDATVSPERPQACERKTSEECKNCALLLTELAERYAKLSSKEQKYDVLTTVPPGTSISRMVSIFGCTTYMAETASKLRHTVGVMCHPVRKRRARLSPELVAKVRQFYTSDENSRVDPGLRNVVYVKNPYTGEKELQPKRVMWITLTEFHREFLQQYPEHKISVSAISLLRPKNIVWAGSSGYHNSCTCIIHENFELLLTACGVNEPLSEILGKFYCTTTSDSCMLGVCKYCPDYSEVDEILRNCKDSEIKFNYWGTQPGAVGFQLLDKTVSLPVMKAKILESIPNIAAHHYIAKKQQTFIQHLREKVVREENSAVLQVDFSQNYSFVTQNAVASHHWSNNQATVHPFVLTWYSRSENEIKKKAFVVISDELKHDATTFHSFKVVVLRLLKKQGFKFEKLYFVSDGASSQFKCVKGFILLMHIELDFGIKAEWHFYATSHGKSECDAIGATVKRSCRLGSLKKDPVTKKQINIRNLDELVSYASKKLSSDTVEIVKVTSTQVQKLAKEYDLEKRFALATTIVGTRTYHSFIPASKTEILVRRYSASLQSKKILFLGSPITEAPVYNIGQYVAVPLLQSFAIGKVLADCTEFGDFEVELMQRSGKGNCFRWSQVPTVQSYSSDEIIRAIADPVASDGHSYKIKISDYKTLNALADNTCL